MVLMGSWSCIAGWRRPLSPRLLSLIIFFLDWTRPISKFRFLLKVDCLGKIGMRFGNIWRHLLMHDNTRLVRRIIISEFGNTSLRHDGSMHGSEFTRVNLRGAHALLRVAFKEQWLLLLDNIFEWSCIELLLQVHWLLLTNNWSRWRLLHGISLVRFASFGKRL